MAVPASLLCLWFKAGCSSAAVASALTFFPPDPPCYRLHEGPDGFEIELEDFLEARKLDGTGVSCEVYVIATRQRTRIPIVLYRSRGARYTLIYSHGNATDIGAMHDRFLGIAESVGVNVLGYDYTGYGAATGHPSESATYGDILAVYEWALTNLCGGGGAKEKDRKRGGGSSSGSSGKPSSGGATATAAAAAAAGSRNGKKAASSGGESGGGSGGGGGASSGQRHRLILYGQSVGSGPSCWLAARRISNSNGNYGNSNDQAGATATAIAGLVLHSPIMSGMRVLTESRLLSCLDIYPNIDRISATRCPLTVFHGMQDEEVHWTHGSRLYTAVPEAQRREPWWIVDRGHNDICEGSGRLVEYHRRLKAFVASLESGGGGGGGSDDNGVNGDLGAVPLPLPAAGAAREGERCSGSSSGLPVGSGAAGRGT